MGAPTFKAAQDSALQGRKDAGMRHGQAVQGQLGWGWEEMRGAKLRWAPRGCRMLPCFLSSKGSRILVHPTAEQRNLPRTEQPRGEPWVPALQPGCRVGSGG